MVLDWLLGQEFLNLINLEELKRRLDDAVEEEGEVNKQDKADDLQPLESLPAEAE